jgi:hypothetical protein
MSRRAVEAVFQALFLLTDIRALMRETAPSHELSAEQKERVATIIEKAKKQMRILEEELLT